MAKKSKNTEVAMEQEEYVAPRRSLAWLWALLSIIFIGMVIVLAHLLGALTPVYKATKDTPVIGIISQALHEEVETVDPQKAIQIKDVVNNVERAEGSIATIRDDIKELKKMSGDIEEIAAAIEKINRKLKELDEGEFEEAAPAAGAQTYTAQTTAAAVAAAPAAAAAAVKTGGQENFRLVGKIFEKIPSDTAVDILNNMTDVEKVKILGAMKEKTVAEILGAFDPVKSAELTRMIAASK